MEYRGLSVEILDAIFTQVRDRSPFLIAINVLQLYEDDPSNLLALARESIL